MPARAKQSQPARTMIYRYLDTNGDGTGTKNAVGDFASTSTNFFLEVATASGTYRIYEFIFTMEDSKGFEPEDYADFGAPLTNGWSVKVLSADNTVHLDIMDGIPIRQNHDLNRHFDEAGIAAWDETTNQAAFARHHFGNDGSPLEVRGGQKIVVALTDDMSGLIDQYFFVRGAKSY